MPIKMGKSKSSSDIKRHLEFLQFCTQPSLIKAIIKVAPETLIKRICDAALNAQKGEVKLSNREKKCFRNHQSTFRKLIDVNIPIEKKRKALCLVQKGRGSESLLVPTLINCVFASLGSNIYTRK